MFYYANSLIKCKNFTQKIMDTFRENGFIKVKKVRRDKQCLNLTCLFVNVMTNTQLNLFRPTIRLLRSVC